MPLLVGAGRRDLPHHLPWHVRAGQNSLSAILAHIRAAIRPNDNIHGDPEG